jgi:hypothetical protein
MAFNSAKESVMMEFNHAAQPTLKEVQKKFGLGAGEIDGTFGVLAMESGGTDTYIVVVTKDAAERVKKSAHPDFLKSWPNSQIGPFGALPPA